MELLPDYLRTELPLLGTQQDIEPNERIVYAKFFIPSIIYTWFVAEGEDQNGNYVFYGYVISEDGEEWKEFPFYELEEVNEKVEELKDFMDMDGLRVERVTNFKPTKFRDAMAEFRNQ